MMVMMMMAMMVMMMMIVMMRRIKMKDSLYVTILEWISHFVAFGHVGGERRGLMTKGFL